MQENNLLSIQKVSNMLKLPKPTLRFWEKELDGILMPLRTDRGQRRYTVENIAVIEEIKKLKRKGMSLPEIKRKLGKGQMSEAGSQRSGDEQTDRVDLLADRVAEVVKAEVNRFFEGET
jgi:DNA-binding transcriptional MerR regulator